MYLNRVSKLDVKQKKTRLNPIIKKKEKKKKGLKTCK